MTEKLDLGVVVRRSFTRCL